MNALKTIFTIKIPENRIFGLDIVRAYAILTVVIFHGEDLLPKEVQNIIRVFIMDGVTVFFCLSGFLIGRILIESIQNERISSRLMFNFWKRRWLRTLPNYFLILTILLLMHYLYNSDFSIFNYSKYFIFSQNLFQVHPSFFREAWSLSVEEWFYFLTPTILYFLIKVLKLKTQTAILLCIISIIVLSVFCRYCLYEMVVSKKPISIDIYGAVIRERVFTRLDSLMLGVLGAYIYLNHRNYWISTKNTFLVLGLIIISFIQYAENNVSLDKLAFPYIFIGLTVIPLGILFTLPFFSTLKNTKGIVGKTIQRISLISYSMYLVNLSIVRLAIINNLEYSNLTKYILYWVITIVLSILLYKYFELPILKWRDKNGK